MVEPDLFHDIVMQLTVRGASTQPSVAVRVLTALFRYLPPDGNEVRATRTEVARKVARLTFRDAEGLPDGDEGLVSEPSPSLPNEPEDRNFAPQTSSSLRCEIALFSSLW